MEKKAPLGVHKNRPTKRNKKGLLKKIARYLKSDYYMFAPVISPTSYLFPPLKTTYSAAPGVKIKKPTKKNDDKFINRVEKFLKSDSYMYAPLIDTQPSISPDDEVINSPPAGPLGCLKKVTAGISTRKTPKKTTQPIEKSKHVEEYLPAEVHPPVASIVGHQETVVHMVHQNCRSSSMPGNRLLGSYLRKLVE